MNKGIVMEITEKNIIVMRKDGRFQRLARKKRSCEIGDEITYADEGINWRSPSVAGRSAIVAAVIFCLVLFASFQGKLGSQEVVAYISIDINPSVEIGIDIRERVLELRGLNEDGVELIQAVDYKEKPLETVTAGILNRAEQTAFSKGEAEIVIASTVIQPDSKVVDTQIAEKLRLQVKEYIQTSHPTQVESYQVASFVAPQEVREAASQNGVSMGKYTVYLNAKSSGSAVTLDELKTKSVLNISKANPEVAQIMVPDRFPTKADIKLLVEEEKSGELDKRLQERLKNREKADTNKHNTVSRPDNNDPKNDQKNSIVPSVSGKNNKDNDDDSKNSRDVNVRPGSSNSSVTIPGAVRQGDKKDDEDNKDDRKRNNNRDDDNRNSGSIKDNKNSEEERRRDEAAKRLEEQKKKEEEARKKQEEIREKDEEQKKKQAEENSKRLEEEKKKTEEQREKAEEKRDKDEKKRKEQRDREEDNRKKKNDDESDSKEEANSGRHTLQNDDGESTKVWNRSFTFPIFIERQ